ncbi:putative Fungal STAND N-terminal Goodbye domain-containing protein [Seiridium unicorne]|uniref:Fungal STAND N-terminal Goodbye domain-containing protein n=1 Tax=Seiridium unicorne TaxID=138068 RepID=A0ABR2UGF9_9PEZI
MEEINYECMIQDNNRLYKVERDLEDIRIDMAKIEDEKKEEQKIYWIDRLESLRNHILPNHQSATRATNAYQFRFDATFKGYWQDAGTRLSQLQRREWYQSWKRVRESSFLLLRGESRDLTHFCWISPLMLRLFRDLQRAGEVVALRCCQTTDTIDRGDELVDMLSHLAIQILDGMSRGLNSVATKSISWKIDSPEWGRNVRLGLKVLAEILSSLEIVTLMIDRADLVHGDWEACLCELALLATPDLVGSCVKIVLNGSCTMSDWRTVKEGLLGLVDEEQVLELECAESDWEA